MGHASFRSTISLIVDSTMLVRLVSTRTTRQPSFCFTSRAEYFLSLPNEVHFSTRNFTLSTRQCLCPLVRLENKFSYCPPTLQNRAGYFLSSVMNAFFSLDNSLSRLDNNFVHSYDSTTRQRIARALLSLVQQPTEYFLSLPNEMHFSTSTP